MDAAGCRHVQTAVCLFAGCVLGPLCVGGPWGRGALPPRPEVTPTERRDYSRRETDAFPVRFLFCPAES